MNAVISYIMQNLPAQLIGFVALFFSATSFQQNSHKKILLFQNIACILFTVHFLMLSAPTAAALNFLSLVRNTVFYFKDKKWASNVFWLYFFLGAFLIAVLCTYEGIISIFPFIGCAVFTASFWITNPKLIRRISWISSPAWLVYNAYKGSWPGIITELIALSSIIIAIFRFDFKARKMQNKEDTAAE